MDKYFLIKEEDGETTVGMYDKEELLKILVDEEFEMFNETMPVDWSTKHWRGIPLIIKGNIVVPMAIEVVKEYDID